MKNILYFLLNLIFFSYCYAYCPDDWIELSNIYVSKHSPVQEIVIFVNSFTEVGPKAGEWHIIDLSPMLPKEARAVFLSGILLITHGSSEEIADLHIHFRAYGDPTEYTYMGQVCETHVSGQRSGMSAWIPLSEDQKFEFMWTRKNLGQWPSWSAYGINLKLNAWGS